MDESSKNDIAYAKKEKKEKKINLDAEGKEYPKAVKHSQKPPKPDQALVAAKSNSSASISNTGGGRPLLPPSGGERVLASSGDTAKFRLALFDHLDRKKSFQNSIEGTEGSVFIHPATLKLGLLYRKGVIQEDDDRVMALIATFHTIFADYSTPPNLEMKRDLGKHVTNQVQYLIESRQHSIGMGNIIKFIKHLVSQINPDFSEASTKRDLIDALVDFIRERITSAREKIAKNCEKLIRDGDVIMTFGSSAAIREILKAISKSKSFHLIVVDTRTSNAGLQTLCNLSENIKCTYTPLSGAAAVMKDVSRVILGASALLSNGTAFAPAGTAMVAALAKLKRLPVIIAAETYKFSDKVQLDSIVYNELGSQYELIKPTHSTQEGRSFVPEISPKFKGTAGDISEADGPSYQVINLRYDLTPMMSISVVATENGLIPPTSIPLLVDELRSEVLC